MVTAASRSMWCAQVCVCVCECIDYSYSKYCCLLSGSNCRQLATLAAGLMRIAAARAAAAGATARQLLRLSGMLRQCQGNINIIQLWRTA